MSSKARKQRLDALIRRFGESGFDRLQRWFMVGDIAKAERRGEKLGGIWYRLDGKHRERCKANLALAFPEMTVDERRNMTLEVYRHFGRLAADFLRSPLRTKQEVLAGVEVVGAENIQKAISIGKGVIAVTGHFGNWERFAAWCTSSGYQISVVARDANQSGVNDRLTKLREAAGITVVSRGNSARAMLSCLRKNQLIGLLPDQNSDECFVPFFGIQTGTVLGPAVLHQRTGAALVPAYCVRTGIGRYKVIVMPPVDPDNIVKDPEAITAELNAALEGVIRQYPEQWLWMHDRWKESRLRGLV